MKYLRFHPEAQLEMVASARFYEAQQVGLGKHFKRDPDYWKNRV